MRIIRTPLRWLWERKLVRALIQFREKKILEVGSATNSYAGVCHESNTVMRVDVMKTQSVDQVEDITKLSFSNNAFDVVILSNVLEHVYDFQKGINETRRVLKKGGKLLIVVPYLFPLHDIPGDYWRFSTFALEKILNDFDAIEIEPIGHARMPFYYFGVATK